VGLKTGLNDVGRRKILPLSGLDPVADQPVPSRYTDCTTPAKKRKYSEKTGPSPILCTTNPTWHDLGSNLGRRGGKPATTPSKLWHGQKPRFGQYFVLSTLSVSVAHGQHD
jgi:hypothetical protein